LKGIQTDRITGESIKDKLSKVNRVTAGALVKYGSFVVGKEVEEVIRNHFVVKQKERREKQKKDEAVF
jgi:cation transport ATPase